MADIAPADVIAFVLRLAFLLMLYAAVGALLLALRRSLVSTPAAGGRRSVRLTLVEAAPLDGPVGRSVSLGSEVTIGRRAACEIALRDDSVSGRHARVLRSRGGWQIEDLGSTNGTFVNGRRLSEPVRLRPGDVIGVGTSTWRFDEAA